MYSDAHTHLTGSPFGANLLTPQEIRTVLKTVRDAGVVLIVAGSHNLASAQRVAEIAAAEDIVYASIGVHPWIAAPLDDATYNAFLALAKQPKVVAVGEVGLDETPRSTSSKEVQLACLIRQLRFARETGLPPIIHQRGWHKELMDLLRREKPPAGIMHGFNGDAAELKDWLDLGYSICIGRSVLEAEGRKLQAVAKLIPADRLVLETDGVQRLTDGKLEGQERVIKVAEIVASWRGTTGPELGDVTTKNLKRLLGIE